jgi:drug/metabolite transporter (DMT)-like permease
MAKPHNTGGPLAGTAASLFALYVIWGSTYFALRIGLEGLGPFWLGGTRFVVAGALLYGFLRLRGAPRPSAREWWASARVGVLLLVISNGMVTYAEQWVSSGVAAVMVATMPLFTALFTRLSRGEERPVAREWAGLLIGFLGVVALNFGSDLRVHPLGAAALLVAPVSWAIGSLWSRKLPLPAGPMATASEMLCGGVVMMGVALLRGERVVFWPGARAAIAWAYLVVFGSLVAFTAYMYLVRAVRPALATSYAYVNPVIALFLGAWLGREHVGALTWGAAAVVIAAVALITLGTRKPAPALTPKPADDQLVSCGEPP